MNEIGPAPVRHSWQNPPLSEARARVLEYLQQQSTPVRIEQVAENFGQHINSVREHLDALASMGLAVRSRRTSGGRGRPSWVYLANPEQPEPDARVREHSALVTALAGYLSDTHPDPAQAAAQAGAGWGGTLVRSSELSADSAASARAIAVELLTELDFAPVPDEAAASNSNDDQACWVLTRCPLLDTARAYPTVVCQVHRGMISGVMNELGYEAEVELHPFDRVGGCGLQVHLP